MPVMHETCRASLFYVGKVLLYLDKFAIINKITWGRGMYTLLLVDDEEEVIQVIMKKINWEGLGFSVIGYANNGVKALEMGGGIPAGCCHDGYPDAVYGRAGIVCAYKSKVSGNKNSAFYRI